MKDCDTIYITMIMITLVPIVMITIVNTLLLFPALWSDSLTPFGADHHRHPVQRCMCNCVIESNTT